MSALNAMLRALVSLVILAVVGWGGWAGYQAYTSHDRALNELREKDAKLAAANARVNELRATVEIQRREIERIQTALKLLKVDSRVAYIGVVDQWQPEGADRQHTRFTFVEEDQQGDPLSEPKMYTIEGDLLYVDAWVVKFKDEFVEQGDAFRSTSLCLFRRLFGEYQKPSEGFEIDSVGSRPAAYGRAAAMSPLEEQLWDRFWDYANSQEKADKEGIRAAHGEAPSIKLQKGKSYKVTLRASGGLSITPDDRPVIVPANGQSL